MMSTGNADLALAISTLIRKVWYIFANRELELQPND
jgi:hypothetical protein